MCELLGESLKASIAGLDIGTFIARLPEPSRSICHALITEGRSVDSVAYRFGISTKTVLRRSRKALVPLALDYDISVTVIRPQSNGKVTAGQGASSRPGCLQQVGRRRGQKVLPENRFMSLPPGK